MKLGKLLVRSAVLAAPLLFQLTLCSNTEAQAADLFLSEYVEASGNNKALEIFNGTGETVNLAGYTIEMYFNATPTAGLTHALSGSIPSGEVFVLSNPAADAAGIIGVSDQTTASSAWFNGNDSLVLKKNGAFLDSIGRIAENPSEWGSGLTSTTDNTLRRKSGICQGDTNPNDAFDPALEWDGFANNDFTGLGVHTASCQGGDQPPAVTSTTPANGGALSANGNISIVWSEPVAASGSWFSLSCSISGIVGASVSGSGNTRTLDPMLTLQAAETCTLTIFAAQVTDLDAAPTPMSSNHVMQLDVVAACGAGGATLIHAIQGSGSASPLAGNVVEIEAVVVGDFQGSDELRGFFVQEESAQHDADPATSEGIFVFDNAGTVAVQVGDSVRVQGQVTEFFMLTELGNVSRVTVCSRGNPLPAPTSVTLPVAAPDTWERWEGMLVAVTGPGGAALAVTETFSDGRYGEVVLAPAALSIPTNLHAPASAERAALASLNARSRIQLDDGRSTENPPTPVPIPYVGPNGTLRRGDTLTLGNLPSGQRVLTGVLNYAFDSYEIQPTVAIDPSSWTTNNPRPSNPVVKGRLKIVSWNALNYFKTLDVSTPAACQTNGNCCGPAGTLECRGAQTPSELTRHEAKLQDALKDMAADVYGLQEIENPAVSGPRSAELALQGMTDLLNTPPNAPGTYAYVATGSVGTDAIKVGFIYKTTSVEAVGSPQVLDDADCTSYRDDRNRPSIAQTFRERSTGEKFTALAAHLKSKGSSCASDGDPIDPNGQGECNAARKAAAECIWSWLATDPTGSGDPDRVVLGDLNAYAKEDPIGILEAHGYYNSVAQAVGPHNHDYVFFGEAGSLSHFLTSVSLSRQVTGAVEWHVMSDEPAAFDYNDFNQAAAYAPDQYRASDHDPIVVGLTLGAATPVPAMPRWAWVPLALALAALGVWASRRSPKNQTG